MYFMGSCLDAEREREGKGTNDKTGKPQQGIFNGRLWNCSSPFGRFQAKVQSIWVSFHMQSWTKFSSANFPHQSGEQLHSSPEAVPSKEEQRHVREDSGKTQARS